MAGERKLTVVIAGDAKGLGSALAQTDSAVGRTGSKFDGMGAKVKVALAGAGLAAIAFGKSSIDAFVGAEASQAKLQAAYEKFPQLANGNIKALQSLNAELAKKTKFDDDATASGQAVLAGFGLTEAQLKRITPLMQDYAERTGKDLPTAAQDLGKAILGQGRALKGVGADFKDTGSAAGNFEQLVGTLDEKVGGFAETAGGTTAGKVAILKNQFGELQEKVGGALIPVLLVLADVGLQIVDFVSNLNPGVLIAVGAVAGLAAAVWIIIEAQKAWVAVQTALNIVMAANPIVLVTLAIAAFVAGLVIAYQNVGWFRDLVDTAFGVIKTVIMGVFNWVTENWPLILAVLTGPIGLAVLAITRNWDTIKNGVSAVKDWIVGRFNDVVGFLTGLPGRIKSVTSGMWDGIKDAFKSAINWIIRGWNRLEFKLPSVDTHIPGVGKIGGWTLGTPDIPTLHSGGLFRSAIPGGEGLALLRDRERVLTPEQDGLWQRVQALVGNFASRIGRFSDMGSLGGGEYARYLATLKTGFTENDAPSPGEALALQRRTAAGMANGASQAGAAGLAAEHRAMLAQGGGNIIQVSFAGAIIASSGDAERWVVEALNRATAKGIR